MPQQLMVAMVVIWGVRLGLHIGIRAVGRGEDPRYAAWRKEWMQKGTAYFVARSFFQVFILQGSIMYFILIPVMRVLETPDMLTLNWIHYVGIALWGIGFLVESIADLQLLLFIKYKKKPGQVYTSGLWRYSRHPNYFGEMVLWWGLFIFSIPFGMWYLSIISPLMISWLLTRVSGVPMLEEMMKKRPEYAEYMRRTNSFIPWFPKKPAQD